MERKIGLTPIPRSGKERVLKVELLPLNIKFNGAEDRTCTYISFREGMCSKLNYSRLINMEAATGFEPVIKVLQTSALPLGYAANNWASWIRTSA